MDTIKNIFRVSGKSGKSKTADDTTAILSIAVVIGVLLIMLYCLSNKNKQQRETQPCVQHIDCPPSIVCQSKM